MSCSYSLGQALLEEQWAECTECIQRSGPRGEGSNPNVQRLEAIHRKACYL